MNAMAPQWGVMMLQMGVQFMMAKEMMSMIHQDSPAQHVS
jgi:hypothetical protein